MEFANRLLALRTERGLTQKQVATELGLPPSSYRDLEMNGASKHLVHVLPRLAEILKVSVAALLGIGPEQSAVENCRQIQELASQAINDIQRSKI